MNGEPYRAPQPTDRRVINRSGQSYQRPDEPQPVKEEAPKTTPRSSGSHHSPEKKSKKGALWTIIALVVLLALGALGWFIWSSSKSATTGIDSSKYQAVFLSNGQIYFGKLTPFNDESFKISTVYYPQAQASDEETEETDVTSAQSNIQLFRITDGVHGPEDTMIIMKSQVLYYENLQENSKVTQLIEQNNQQ